MASRLSASLLRSALALSRRAQLAPRPPLPSARAVLLFRPLSISAPRRASEVPPNPLADPEIQGFYEKIRNHQGAVDAMMNLGRILQEKGVDTTRPPSALQMMKLSMDKDMREAGQKLVEEMRNAGVEMNPETLFEKMRQQ